MTAAMGVSLARVTIRTPQRWMDVALPEDVPVAELLPYVLRHAEESAADDGERHGGWVLRRPTGESLDSRRTLGAQQVLDGEVLHLVPGQLEWPELEYDDLVESIASGARRYGRAWSRTVTRRCGLTLCAVALLAGLLVATQFTAPWTVPGLVLLGSATVLLIVGVLIARSLPDAYAGAVFAGSALPYAFTGGFVITGPSHVGLTGMGAPQLLLGSAVTLVFSVVGLVGVTVLARLFTATIALALSGLIGALLAGPLEPDSAAAVTVTLAIGLLPAYPLLSVRLGRMPLPVLPQRDSDLLEDTPAPPARTVFDAAARTDDFLTGVLTAVAVVAVICAAYLVVDGGLAQLMMVAVVGVALFLRSRLFMVTRQRTPLLLAGVVVALMLAVWFLLDQHSTGERIIWLGIIAVLAGLIAYTGLVYSTKNPSPYLGRFADVFDVVAVLALVPLTGFITGFFLLIRSAMAGIG